MLLPFMEEKGGQVGNGSHPSRYDMSGKRTVVISTCGFYTARETMTVYIVFSITSAGGKLYDRFCGQGELFRSAGAVCAHQ